MTGRTKGKDPEMVNEALKSYLDAKFDAIASNMATKDCLKSLSATIARQDEKISILESKVAILEKHVEALSRKANNQEQYNRRLCLRINGIPLPRINNESESADECLNKVKDVFKEIGVAIPDEVIDRAHRIGKVQKSRGKKSQQMIVKFTMWRHRTMVYRARKNAKKVKIHLDLTKSNLDLLIRANERLKGNDENFAFADVNCRLCLKLDGEFKYLETEHEFLNLIGQSHSENSSTGENDDRSDDPRAENVVDNDE